jgi:outer membrane immunogenic protein
MKKFLLSTVAVATMTAGAMAADLPARRMAPAPFAAVPVFTWTGFYVGANVGAAWNSNRRDDFGLNNYTAAGLPVVPAAGGTFFGTGLGVGNNGRNASILGGVQIGYNWQMMPGSGFVLGVEGDIQAIGNRNRNNAFFGGTGPFGTAAVNGAIALPVVGAPGNVAFFGNGNNGLLGGNGSRGGDWFGTARVRVGYAVDRALFYVTGGLAFTDDRNRNNGFFGATNFGGTSAGVPAPFFVGAAPAPAVVATNNAFFGNNDRNNIGWALGAGIEYAFTNSLSAKIEYLHLGFDRNRNNGLVGAGNVVGVTNLGVPVVSNAVANNGNRRNSVDLVRVGLNWRFNGF